MSRPLHKTLDIGKITADIEALEKKVDELAKAVLKLSGPKSSKAEEKK